MRDDDIDLLDVRNALLNATKAEEQTHEDGIRYLVTGKDTNKRPICVVMQIAENPPGVVIVTVWRPNRKK